MDRRRRQWVIALGVVLMGLYIHKGYLWDPLWEWGSTLGMGSTMGMSSTYEG